jgi:hypothetical protein
MEMMGLTQIYLIMIENRILAYILLLKYLLNFLTLIFSKYDFFHFSNLSLIYGLNL